jgi:hypothetical protein
LQAAGQSEPNLPAPASTTKTDAHRDPASALGDGEGPARLIAIFVNGGATRFREHFALMQPSTIRDCAQISSLKIQ